MDRSRSAFSISAVMLYKSGVLLFLKALIAVLTSAGDGGSVLMSSASFSGSGLAGFSGSDLLRTF